MLHALYKSNSSYLWLHVLASCQYPGGPNTLQIITIGLTKERRKTDFVNRIIIYRTLSVNYLHHTSSGFYIILIIILIATLQSISMPENVLILPQRGKIHQCVLIIKLKSFVLFLKETEYISVAPWECSF